MTLVSKVLAVLFVLFNMPILANAQGRFERGHAVVIDCASNRFNDNYCYVGEDVRFARLLRQYSDSSCIEGSSWGVSYDSIWVRNGCRGQFEVVLGGGGYHPGPHPGPGYGRSESLTCSSIDFRFNTCYPSSGYRIRDAYLERQLSDTQCIEGSTWGYDNNRIWVDRGCRGTFNVRTY